MRHSSATSQIAICLALVGALAAGLAVATARENSDPGLTGIVRDAAGDPLPSVWVHRIGAKNRLGIPVWTRTDIEGRFRIAKPPAGSFSLRLVPGTTSLTDGVVRKFEAAPRRLEIVMDPGPVLDVRIAKYVPTKGKPRYARVTWMKKDGRRPTRYAPVQDDGCVRFVGVPVDTLLELWALAAPRRPVHVSNLKAGPKPVDVASVEGKTITGVVLGVTAKSVRRASVTAYAREHFKVGRVTLRPSGAFEITDLPPGTYTLRAQFTSGAVSLSPAVTAEAGARDVTLDLR